MTSKDADGLAGVHSILQDGSGFGGLEMVERSEHGTEAAELGRDFGGVHRSGMKSDVICEAEASGFESVKIWIFIGKQDLQGRWRDILQPAGEVEPGAAASGAHINHRRRCWWIAARFAGAGRRGRRRRSDSCRFASVSVISSRRNEGNHGLFVEFDELYAAQRDFLARSMRQLWRLRQIELCC